MRAAARFLARYRVVGTAVAVSAALHASVLVGVPANFGAADEAPAFAYSATLEEAAPPAAAAPAPAAPKPASTRVVRRHFARAHPKPQPAPAPVVATPSEPQEPAMESPPLAAANGSEGGSASGAAAEAPPPEPIAYADPLAPPGMEPKPPAEPQPEPFPMEGLPEKLSITYELTSAFADAKAVYRWSRDGDRYTITGEGQAIGFFQLFLEGRILQESYGVVTAAGLRPERFTEQKPNSSEEGVTFDWLAHRVTLEHGDKVNTKPLAENAVDWLSMIFQLAHQPPKGDAVMLPVYTQRKFYNFKLQVLGIEPIRIPIGQVNALHLRHVDPDDPTEIVDVWLGVDQHYLPVKLRYPVAHNRFMVDQVATSLTGP